MFPLPVRWLRTARRDGLPLDLVEPVADLLRCQIGDRDLVHSATQHLGRNLSVLTAQLEIPKASASLLNGAEKLPQPGKFIWVESDFLKGGRQHQIRLPTKPIGRGNGADCLQTRFQQDGMKLIFTLRAGPSRPLHRAQCTAIAAINLLQNPKALTVAELLSVKRLIKILERNLVLAAGSECLQIYGPGLKVARKRAPLQRPFDVNL